MSQLGGIDFVGASNEIARGPIFISEPNLFDGDRTRLQEEDELYDGQKKYKIAEVIAGTYNGVEIYGYSGLYIPILGLDRDAIVKAMDSPNHTTLAISIEDTENVMPCLLQYGFNDYVLGYRKDEKFYFFVAQVDNSGFTKHPDIAVDRIENYNAFFIKPLPEGFKYVIGNNEVSIQVIYILDEQNNVIKLATF